MEAVKKISILKIAEEGHKHTEDWVSVEEPLEIRLQYGHLEDRKRKSVSITMRTPGDDTNLALGFLKNEGIIRDMSAVIKCSLQTFHKGELNPNIITVNLHPEVSLQTFSLERNFYTTSSCGLCGKASIEAIQQLGLPPIQMNNIRVSFQVLKRLPEYIRDQQKNFQATGGLHATALFDTEGKLVHITEDVGRHNAMDKLSGWCMQHNAMAKDKILLLSGRASFELIQKAAMTGVPIVCAVGAPSSLAVETAAAAGITLTGFTKATGLNVYTHMERILLD